MKIKYKVKEEKWVPCTSENTFIGATVKRGEDWDWGNQDENKLGIVDGEPFKDSSGEIWIYVKWPNKIRNTYRIFNNKDLLIKLI